MHLLRSFRRNSRRSLFEFSLVDAHSARARSFWCTGINPLGDVDLSGNIRAPGRIRYFANGWFRKHARTVLVEWGSASVWRRRLLNRPLEWHRAKLVRVRLYYRWDDWRRLRLICRDIREPRTSNARVDQNVLFFVCLRFRFLRIGRNVIYCSVLSYGLLWKK